ncbi:hypothetical protein BT69DRAFT_1211612 [Atractiella rhizophila]|nr:hypothetical protein BT69DRAFT_1221715 [Atractiella rhizophila]KAH8929340.1 hypothetical protein BT69DRAFT_1211612 [Atractiella rhizophila]
MPSFYTTSLVGLFLLVLLGLAFLLRNRLIPHLPPRIRSRFTQYERLPTFESAIGAGLSSSTFDLSANVESGDTRGGLEESAADEVRRIMEERGVGFDEARLIRQQRYLARHGIGPDGMPLDKKAVHFGR